MSRVSVVAATALLLWGTGAHATASNKELEARADEMDARLMAVERANQTLVEVQQQIETAREEMRTLRGQIEEARHELDSLRQQQRELYSDLDRRLLMIENNGVAASGAARPVAGVPPVVQPGAASRRCRAGRARQPRRRRSSRPMKPPSTATRSPRSRPGATRKRSRASSSISRSIRRARAPTAQPTGSARRSTSSAITRRDQVVHRVGTAYPNSRKAADALLKVGFCQYELKAFRNARATLQKVAATYPGTETARFAEERLAKMDVEGR